MHLSWKQFAPHGEAWHISSYLLSPDASPHLHTQDYAEVYWVLEGEVHELFPDSTRVLKRGQIAWAQSGVLHGFRSSAWSRLFNVAFPHSTEEAMRTLMGSAWLMSDDPALPSPFGDPAIEELNRIALELFYAPQQPLSVWRFLIRLLCLLEEPDFVLSGDVPDWLVRACSEIRRPELTREGVNAFVRLAGRSREHVARVARRCTGKSPREHVLEARLDRMAQLLLLTDRSILDIAADVGFENLGYAYARFKERYKMPPGTYRREHHRMPLG